MLVVFLHQSRSLSKHLLHQIRRSDVVAMCSSNFQGEYVPSDPLTPCFSKSIGDFLIRWRQVESHQRKKNTFFQFLNTFDIPEWTFIFLQILMKIFTYIHQIITRHSIFGVSPLGPWGYHYQLVLGGCWIILMGFLPSIAAIARGGPLGEPRWWNRDKLAMDNYGLWYFYVRICTYNYRYWLLKMSHQVGKRGLDSEKIVTFYGILIADCW